MAEALIQFGISTTDDTEMVAQIKSEVCKLGNPNIIASEIFVNEADENYRKKMIYLTEEDIEVLFISFFIVWLHFFFFYINVCPQFKVFYVSFIKAINGKIVTKTITACYHFFSYNIL